MEITVKIKWDNPEEQQWLNPDNIKTTLSSYCKNTNFEVESIDANDKVIEAIGWTHADCCTTLDNGGDPRKTVIPNMLERAKKDLKL